MDKQPEALRLAGKLYERVITRWVHATGTTPRQSGYSPDTMCHAAADELKRLHTVNVALVEALQAMLDDDDHDEAKRMARAAIAQAKEKQ